MADDPETNCLALSGEPLRSHIETSPALVAELHHEPNAEPCVIAGYVDHPEFGLCVIMGAGLPAGVISDDPIALVAHFTPAGAIAAAEKLIAIATPLLAETGVTRQ